MGLYRVKYKYLNGDLRCSGEMEFSFIDVALGIAGELFGDVDVYHVEVEKV